MNNIIRLSIFVVVLVSGCYSENLFDGPTWGDPCMVEKKNPDVTLHACHWNGEAYQIGVCQEISPGSDEGACRPFCEAGECPEGGKTRRGPLGLCYCAE